MESPYQSDSIYWVEVDRIKPNPYQPRRTFDEAALASLAESIRQYGVLQPLTVVRKEIERPEEGIFVEYELIAGERRLRAAKLAGIMAVPVVIRAAEDSDRMKLELAIIENLQREDLSPIDRAEAFHRLVSEFGLKHTEISKRVGKSREYVSNTIRILALPQEIKTALAAGEITEGHSRPLLMLIDRPEEQMTLFRDVLARRLTVRDTEALARRVAIEKVRHKALVSPDLMSLEKQLSERLGTRVRIEKKDTGGKLMIDFFSPEDLTQLCLTLTGMGQTKAVAEIANVPLTEVELTPDVIAEIAPEVAMVEEPIPEAAPIVAQEKQDEDLYSISNFSV
jgi:ParB family chromosome partitioning protein